MSHDSPSRHVSLLHEPAELPLGEHCILQVEATVFVHIRLPDPQLLTEPRVLRVSVVILGGTQGMSHAFMAVDDGARKIVRRVHPAGGQGAQAEVKDKEFGLCLCGPRHGNVAAFS